jgi:hypothetical protein
MKLRNVLACAAVALALAAGNACAQRGKVAPAPVYYDDAVEVTLPGDNTFQIRLDGLKAVRAVWMVFAGYPNAKPPRDPQVIMLMEGTSARWGAPDGGCTYEFRIVNGAAPAVTMAKTSLCTLRDGEKALFRVLAL